MVFFETDRLIVKMSFLMMQMQFLNTGTTYFVQDIKEAWL